VHTRAPEALKMLAPHHEVQEHVLIPFHGATIVLPCEAGERCVQNPVPGTKLKKICELRGCNLMKLIF
jgi:hypothetical protein